MVRMPVLIAAGLLFAPAPAAAAIVAAGITGTLSRVQTTILCNQSSPADCLQSTGGGLLVERSDQAFFFDLPNLPVNREGDIQFNVSTGEARFVGVINNAGGVLTGRDLNVAYRGNCDTGQVGCSYASGFAATFDVISSVPEPTTWAMMVFAFGAIGWTMRRRRVAQALTA